MSESRFIVGIDLGTTNCSVSYVDTSEADTGPAPKVAGLMIPQLVAPGEVRALPYLPSFVYLPDDHDVAEGALNVPWSSDNSRRYAVGAFARDMAATVPGKVVASAKSWLCVEGVDGHAEILPVGQGDGARRVSPVAAARLLLEHLKQAWHWQFARANPEHALERQTVYLTVPASFDAMAREMTAQAAAEAGLAITLLEEPLAAFYAWLHDHHDDWREFVAEGDTVLVCDVGGGTTDFTLIIVTGEDGALSLERVAVGDHILLGGDNMDLTLAYTLAAKIQHEQGVQLDTRQLAALTHACREAKEKLGDTHQPTTQTLTVLGRGTGVVGGSLSVELTRDEMNACLVDGFFPLCDITDTPRERRRMGLRSFGLSYASDPAVTKYVAGFINKHSFKNAQGYPLLPAAVLFNGGVSKSDIFRDRVLETLRAWGKMTGQEPETLMESDPDMAVGVGAAWYGWVRRSGGVRIKSGAARSYYLGVESSVPAVPGFTPPMDALCVLSFGMEEGSSAEVPVNGLGLVVGEPTEFRFFSSSSRQHDTVGQTLTGNWGDDLVELPPLVAELPVEAGGNAPLGSLVPVNLEVDFTEVGTLQVWCLDTRGGGRWKLEFNAREPGELS
ncbi:MAG: Hsp70 family protein [Lentisphaeria bacterium]|nr:Hsp70 family protein [Lentisphaeria bacterium]